MQPKNNIETDITVYGATSFVAKHVIRYLLEASAYCSVKPRITFGGRTEGKLGALRTHYKAHENGSIIQDIFVASASDFAALKEMARRSLVVLNCAGPYSAYSRLVVAACAEVGTDYVDITGEVHWVADMRQKYGSLAKESGARIISLCGFDSVPSDISVFAAVEALRGRRGRAVEIESARIWHYMIGFPNGGTIQTLADMPIDLFHDFVEKKDNNFHLRKVPFVLGDPLLLAHPEQVRHNPEFQATKNRLAWSNWVSRRYHRAFLA